VLVLGVNLVDVSKDTETGNTTIRVHAEADVSVGLGGGLLELESVTGTRVKRNLGQDRAPGNLSPLLMGAGGSLGGGSLAESFDRDEGGVVSSEVGGIDLESGNVSWVSKLDNAPIIVRGVVATSLPSIVPGTGGNEATWGRNGGGGGQEVGTVGEPLIGEGKNLASARSNSKICWVYVHNGWLVVCWICPVGQEVDRDGEIRSRQE
jgi:hypothetical protein